MVLAASLVTGVALSAFAQEEDLRPRLVTTEFVTADVVVALVELGPQEEEDTTPRLQGVIDRVAGAGGGVVFLGSGRYPIRTPVVIREGVTLRGDWPGAEGRVGGTILAVSDRAGEVDGAETITLERGSGIRNLSMWYPEQRHDVPVPYPWTIGTAEGMGGDNTTVMDVTLVNPFRGIRIGPEWNELHTIRNVHMTPLDVGFSTDTTTDIGRINGLTIGPEVWEGSGLPNAPAGREARGQLRTYLRRNVLGVDIGRSDWEFIVGVKASGLATGIRFRAGVRGTANAVMLECSILDCGTGIELAALNGVGLAATACTIERCDTALAGAGSFTTVAQFNTCQFSSPGTAVRLFGQGTLTFQNCTIDGSAEADAGAVSFLDCAFSGAGPHVVLREDVSRARILGCRFEGVPDIQRPGGAADIAVSHRPLAAARLEYRPRSTAPAWVHQRRVLYNASARGASGELADSTAALQGVLDRAGSEGGGIVYLPAGLYRCEGSLTVPTGVMLRGCFDVPHHTISAGSVLMPVGGKGDEDGAPFIRMQSGSALRGLTLWYPEQDMTAPSPYPWAIRGLGPGCRIEDVTLGNAWQGVDFWTHPSDGHVIRYLAGTFFRRALFVSKCDAAGWVEDVHFNPHYSVRLHASLPHLPIDGSTIAKVIDFQREHLEGMVFGRCALEQVFATFLYAAYDGLAFRDDDGGANARVLVHGTDTGSRALVFESCGAHGLEFVNTQLVALGNWVQSAIVSESGFTGTARLFNSQVWAGPSTAKLEGGSVHVQQLNTRSGPIEVNGGRHTLENVLFSRDLTPHVTVGAGTESVVLRGSLSEAGVLRWDDAGGAVQPFANAGSLGTWLDSAREYPGVLSLAFDQDDSRVVENRIASTAGGQRGVSEAGCEVVTHPDPDAAGRVLKLTGAIEEEDYAYCYFAIADGPLAVLPDTVLRYRMKPLNEAGRNAAVDLAFRRGKPLRDRGVRSRDGVAAHPSVAKGTVGEWLQLEFPLGQFAGEIIDEVMVAFDSRNTGGRFEVLFDDVQVVSELATVDWRLSVEPSGGVVPPGTRVAIETGAHALHYTLDGTNPSLESPVYSAPIALPAGKTVEVRAALEIEPGVLGPLVFCEVYDVEGMAREE